MYIQFFLFSLFVKDLGDRIKNVAYCSILLWEKNLLNLCSYIMARLKICLGLSTNVGAFIKFPLIVDLSSLL